MDKEEIKLIVKLKFIFWFKLGLCKFSNNEVWSNNFLNDLEDKPNRYFKVKLLETKPHRSR